ncbi:phage tail tube protein [Acinetobacter bereziniae]|uniref:phage tail tube protein n=1 Tax=Acinetobacter bereziniae TaxID=106648 RepID=UPI000EF707EB|nr:hypothetical protein [Acinetobacter bereziniae]
MRKDFSRQGPFYLGANNNGKTGAMRWIGDTGNVSIAIAETKEERKENYTGLRGTSVVLSQGTTITVELNVRYGDAENLALAMHGKVTTKAAGTVTAEIFPTGEVGQYFVLDHAGVSDLVLTDSTPSTPVTLTEGTHYRIASNQGGMIELLSTTGITQPIKAAYSYAGARNLSILTKRPQPMYLIMDCINTVDGSRERLHLYKVQFDPIANMGLIDESLGEFTLTGTCYVDAVNQLDDDLGPYGRFEQLDEVP